MSEVKLSILFVDDERIICESVHDYFNTFDIRTFEDPLAALDEMRGRTYDIVIVDYRMPKMSGLDLLIEAKMTGSYRYGILLTTYAETELLETFINHNLIRKVLEKPLDLTRLGAALEEAASECEIEKHQDVETARQNELLQTLLKGTPDTRLPKRILGLSGGLKKVFEQARQYAMSDENVLITGETGVGKEVMARLIHAFSSRAKRPFVKINCGSIPDTLIESELFGFSKGAFSGATHNKPGRIEAADEGTLFLDEVTELKPELQTRLLDVVQDKTVERLGDISEISVNFRLIAATNRNPNEAMRQGVLREDLYFRLSTLPLAVPPIRDYREDIEEFVTEYLELFAEELNRKLVTISPEALRQLKEYSWPGNIRELENVITRALILLEKDRTELSEKDFAFLKDSVSRSAAPDGDAIASVLDLITQRGVTIDGLERQLLKRLLQRFGGDVMEVARKTGIPKDRLYRLKK